MHEDGVHQIQAGWQRIRVRRAGGLQRKRRAEAWQLGAGPRPGVSQKDAAGGGARCRDRNAAGRVEDDRLLRAADCADCKQKSPPRRTSGRYHLPGKKGQSRKAGHAGRQADRPGLGGRKAAWIEDDLDIEPYLAKGYNTDEGLPKLTELRLGMRMGFDESSYDDPTLSLRIIKKRRVHQLRDWAREQGLLPPMYYEDPVHGIDKNQLRELLIGIANGIMPDTYGLKLIKLHKCGPRVLREMRLCREAGMTGKEIRPYWALGVKKLQEVRAAFLAAKETDDGQ